VRAAEEAPLDLGAMTDHLAIAVLAHRRHTLDGTFEAVERVALARRHDLEGFVVVVTAHLALGHVYLPDLCPHPLDTPQPIRSCVNAHNDGYPKTMRAAISLIAVASLAVACADEGDDTATDGAPEATVPADTGPAGTAPATQPVDVDPLFPLGEVQTLVGGLDVPWDLAEFAEGDAMFVTERAGRVRVIERGELRPEPVLTLDVEARGEAGLLGIALHPEFDQQRFAFVYYTTATENRISRFLVGDDLAFSDETILLDGIPAARTHDGGRIAFGPDGYLYATTGDAGDPESASDLGSLAGKILRLTADGSVPADNPFPDSLVYSFGHRNPQGLDWDRHGNLYISDHGPSGEFGLCCHDELNLIEPGGYYGWPFFAGEVAAAPGELPAERIEPIATSGESTWAPAGIAVVDDGDGTAILVAGLASQQLLRFDVSPDDPRSVTAAGAVLDGAGRLRAVMVAADGCLVVATSNTDGRGDPQPNDDRLLRAC
jgi:aldose sugar dehydrogenase